MTDNLAGLLFGGGKGSGMVGVMIYALALTVAGCVFSWFITLSLWIFYSAAFLTILPWQSKVPQRFCCTSRVFVRQLLQDAA